MGSMLKAWMTNISNWHFAISIDSSFSYPFEFSRFFSYNEGFFLFPVFFIDSWQRTDIDRPQSKGNTLFITRNLLKRNNNFDSDKQIQIFSVRKAVKIVNIKLMLDSQIFQVR